MNRSSKHQFFDNLTQQTMEFASIGLKINKKLFAEQSKHFPGSICFYCLVSETSAPDKDT